MNIRPPHNAFDTKIYISLYSSQIQAEQEHQNNVMQLLPTHVLIIIIIIQDDILRVRRPISITSGVGRQSASIWAFHHTPT